MRHRRLQPQTPSHATQPRRIRPPDRTHRPPAQLTHVTATTSERVPRGLPKNGSVEADTCQSRPPQFANPTRTNVGPRHEEGRPERAQGTAEALDRLRPAERPVAHRTAAARPSPSSTSTPMTQDARRPCT